MLTTHRFTESSSTQLSLSGPNGIDNGFHRLAPLMHHWPLMQWRQQQFKVDGTKRRKGWDLWSSALSPEFFYNLEMACFGEFWGAKFKVCNNIIYIFISPSGSTSGRYSHWRPPTKILGMCPRHPRRGWRQCVDGQNISSYKVFPAVFCFKLQTPPRVN